MADEPHPQVRTILETMDARPVPPVHAVSVERAREQLERLAGMHGDGPEVGEVRDLEIAGPGGPLPLRLYLPAAAGPHPTLVYFHGGGFVLGSLDTHDALCRALTAAAGCAVLSVGYRLAPEHPFPAAVADAAAAVEWVAANGDTVHLDRERVAVGGDSAGGNLAAATTLLARDRDGPDLAHQSLVYPAVSSPVLPDHDSYEENGEGYFLETETVEWFLDQYVQDDLHLRNEYFAPALARDLSGLPPATVVTAGFDPLRDEGRAYADRLEAAGVDVERHHFDAMIHGYATMLGMVDAARETVEALAADLTASF